MNGFKVGGGICIPPLPVLWIRVWIFVIKCGNKSDKDPGIEKAPNIKMKNRRIKTFNIFFFWVTFLHIIMINREIPGELDLNVFYI